MIDTNTIQMGHAYSMDIYTMGRWGRFYNLMGSCITYKYDIVDPLFGVHPIGCRVLCLSLFFCALLCVRSCFAIILKRK